MGTTYCLFGVLKVCLLPYHTKPINEMARAVLQLSRSFKSDWRNQSFNLRYGSTSRLWWCVYELMNPLQRLPQCGSMAHRLVTTALGWNSAVLIRKETSRRSQQTTIYKTWFSLIFRLWSSELWHWVVINTCLSRQHLPPKYK